MHRHYSCNNSHFIFCVTAWLSLAIRSQRKKAEWGGFLDWKGDEKPGKERAEPREEEKSMNGRGEKQKKISEA